MEPRDLIRPPLGLRTFVNSSLSTTNHTGNTSLPFGAVATTTVNYVWNHND